MTQAAFSHEHKFIFLMTKKTAGTSIELALTQLCGTDYIIAPLTEIDEARRIMGAVRRTAGGDPRGAAGSNTPAYHFKSIAYAS